MYEEMKSFDIDPSSVYVGYALSALHLIPKSQPCQQLSPVAYEISRSKIKSYLKSVRKISDKIKLRKELQNHFFKDVSSESSRFLVGLISQAIDVLQRSNKTNFNSLRKISVMVNGSILIDTGGVADISHSHRHFVIPRDYLKELADVYVKLLAIFWKQTGVSVCSDCQKGYFDSCRVRLSLLKETEVRDSKNLLDISGVSVKIDSDVNDIPNVEVPEVVEPEILTVEREEPMIEAKTIEPNPMVVGKSGLMKSIPLSKKLMSNPVKEVESLRTPIPSQDVAVSQSSKALSFGLVIPQVLNLDKPGKFINNLDVVKNLDMLSDVIDSWMEEGHRVKLVLEALKNSIS